MPIAGLDAAPAAAAAPRPGPRPRATDPRGPAFALALVAVFAALTASAAPAEPGSAVPWTVDPSGRLGAWRWTALCYILTVPAKETLNSILLWIGNTILRLRRIDEGSAKVRKLEVLEGVDMAYLVLNTLVEFVGINHLLAFLLRGSLEQRAQAFGVVNGPVAFLVVMLVNDALYYPFHAIAHQRSFYPYCHKQHHRQFVPFRGYLDAANQHPFEQLSGFSIFLLSLHGASRTIGLHLGTACVAVLAWAVLNICNHLAFDSRVHLPLPYPAYPRDHQMHHRFPQCNYSTLTTMFDRAFGSFRPYVALDAAASPRSSGMTCRRIEALPSPWSFIGLLLCLAIVVALLELRSTSSSGGAGDLAGLARAALGIGGAALACATAESAAAASARRRGPGGVPDVVRTAQGEATPPRAFGAPAPPGRGVCRPSAATMKLAERD